MTSEGTQGSFFCHTTAGTVSNPIDSSWGDTNSVNSHKQHTTSLTIVSGVRQFHKACSMLYLGFYGVLAVRVSGGHRAKSEG